VFGCIAAGIALDRWLPVPVPVPVNRCKPFGSTPAL
jgi:hypothetical protein